MDFIVIVVVLVIVLVVVIVIYSTVFVKFLQCVDVTMELQALVTGRLLRVCQDVNLDKVFSKDPAQGLRKQLHFSYTTLGFRGNLRVRERDDYFVAGIQLGYPPVPPRDEYQDYAVASTTRK